MFQVGSAFAGRPLVEDLGASGDTQRFRAQARDGTDRYLVLAPHRDERTISRLRRAQKVSGTHAGLATIEDIVQHSLTVAVVSEWPAMGSLRDRSRYLRPMTGEAALEVMLPVIDALRALHAGALVHGSIDVDTIRFRDGTNSSATLCGFGAIGAGSKELPRPPEIDKGKRTTPATDVFSVCALLDWLVRDEQDARPRELAHIIDRGTRAMAAARFVNADDLYEALVNAAVQHTDAVPIFPADDTPDEDTSECDEVTTPEPGIPCEAGELDDEWLEDSASMLSVTGGEPYDDESLLTLRQRAPKREKKPKPEPISDPLRKNTASPTFDNEDKPAVRPFIPIALGAGAVCVTAAAIWATIAWTQNRPVEPTAGPPGVVTELLPTRGFPRYAVADILAHSGTVGSPDTEARRDEDEAPLEIDLPTFQMGTYEVTQEQWQAVMGSDPSTDYHGDPPLDGSPQPCVQYGHEPDMPVICVTWLDAVHFANKLSAAHKLPPAYEISGAVVTWDRTSTGFRLPTEAEWELAAREGDQTPHGPYGPSALCGFGVFANRATMSAFPHLEPKTRVPCNSDDIGLTAIGSKRGARNGLYDMLGNVAEWTWDPYNAQGVANTAVDHVEVEVSAERVARGSSWASPASHTRLAHREGLAPTTRSYLVGFRLARGAYEAP